MTNREVNKVKHLDQQLNSNYFHHLWGAWKYGWNSLVTAIVFFVHGIFPEIWSSKGGYRIVEVHEKVQQAWREQKAKKNV